MPLSPSRALLIIVALALCLPAAAETPPCADAPLKHGFYAYFAPVSYSADIDPDSADFNQHLGYEADLLSALEAMEGAGLRFERSGIDLWEEIWLRAAGDEYDIISGGITILDSRTRDADGNTLIRFTGGHITFRQSLLVRADDAERLDSHAMLTSDLRVGALPGTTGEIRMLQLTGYIDDDGIVLDGTRVETPDGEVVADGSADYVITAGGESPALRERLSLQPPVDSMPQVIYLSSETGKPPLEEALAKGEVDALARGAIGNHSAAHASDGAFVVTALDDAIEQGGFALDADADALAACLDDKINWLTAERAIGMVQWLEDPAVFMARAELWNAQNAPGDDTD